MLKETFAFFVNRLGILYAGTGAVNAIMISGWLFVLTQFLSIPLVVSTLVAVLTSIFTDYTWKSVVVFRTAIRSWDRFGKYFANSSLATAVQYVLTLVLSTVIFYTFAYIIAVAIGFALAYTISVLKIWKVKPT